MAAARNGPLIHRLSAAASPSLVLGGGAEIESLNLPKNSAVGARASLVFDILLIGLVNFVSLYCVHLHSAGLDG